MQHDVCSYGAVSAFNTLSVKKMENFRQTIKKYKNNFIIYIIIFIFFKRQKYVASRKSHFLKLIQKVFIHSMKKKKTLNAQIIP